MKCPTCRKQFHPQPTGYRAYWVDANDQNSFDAYAVASQQCPSCGSLVIYLELGSGRIDEADLLIGTLREQRVVYPVIQEKPVPAEIPDEYRQELVEARVVLEHSPKASAALSRRLLQQVLRERLGIRRRDLSQEIDAFIESSSAPTYLTDAVDAVRQIGNFAAHPLKNTNTGEVTNVEDGEAEWTLEVVESLLDFACVQPVKLENRRNALNQKLSDLGKPSLKGA